MLRQSVALLCGGLLLLLFCVDVGDAAASADKSDFQKDPTKTVWAVVGRDVELPCDVTPPVHTDAVNIVFWFKDSIRMPLYSLDARGGSVSQAQHLAMTDDLGGRSYFITEEDPTKSRLKIQRVTAEDEGMFKCRVDFINSPTRNFRVNLTLVVQPTPPQIFDAEGREITKEAGPFLEGHELFLSCQVSGGRPHPTLTWWYNDTILDSVVDSNPKSYTTVNQLAIAKVPRSLKGGLFKCQATSLEIAGNITREVPIVIYLKPNKVKIVSPNELLSSSKVQAVRCETSGSYPPAKLTWTLEGKPIRDAVLTEEETKTFTSSIISLSVDAKDDGKELVCRADNPRFPGGFVEDRRKIYVAYPPRVTVHPESLELGSPIKEGSPAVLKCDHHARPAPASFNWYHNGHIVPFNETAGLLPVDNTLTIRSVQKGSEGDYSCSATNTEGETYSSPFTLTVQYAPRCRKGYEITRVGAIAHESLVVECRVDAMPDVTRFHWTYNTSKGVLPVVKGAKMQNRAGVSVLHFTPGSTDVESLSCWATNDVGRQEQPCLFQIIPAFTPDPPSNCMMKNASNGGLEVVCVAGKDGGLQQSFVLEVEDHAATPDATVVTTLSDQGGHSTPLYRVLGETPIFRLHSLEPNKDYQLVVYAVNAKGRSSPPVVLSNVRVQVPVDRDLDPGLSINYGGKGAGGGGVGGGDGAGTPINLTVLLVILAGVAMLLIIGIVAVAAFLACRRSPVEGSEVVLRRPRRSSKPPEELELSEAGFNEGFHRRSAQYRASLYAIDDVCERTASIGRPKPTGPDLILAPVNFPLQSSDY